MAPGRRGAYNCTMATTNTGDTGHPLWAAVLARDASRDGAFVFAVLTTRIYCRPSCPARRPHRERVVFFGDPDAAEAGGFRACRRCHPRAAAAPGNAWLRRICRLIEGEAQRPPSLARLARAAGVSPAHLQRAFKAALGLSPAAYAEALRVSRFRAALRRGVPVEQAAGEAGYGSAARAHARATPALGMTPGAFRKGGDGMRIRFTIVDSPLGRLLVGATSLGVSAVQLADEDARLLAALRADYPRATLERDDRALAARVLPVLARLAGRGPQAQLPLDVQATAFQRRVWDELQRIPRGETRSYAEVARAIGRPGAARAVARACATNPVAVVVPCHRVVGKDGRPSGYRWGVARKQRLLEAERR
jgi:AraC family transcriptional regulator of adaptative response/methylated-DNA-[protein]-cysteine methyltransferase